MEQYFFDTLKTQLLCLVGQKIISKNQAFLVAHIFCHTSNCAHPILQLFETREKSAVLAFGSYDDVFGELFSLLKYGLKKDILTTEHVTLIRRILFSPEGNQNGHMQQTAAEELSVLGAIYDDDFELIEPLDSETPTALIVFRSFAKEGVFVTVSIELTTQLSRDQEVCAVRTVAFGPSVGLTTAHLRLLRELVDFLMMEQAGTTLSDLCFALQDFVAHISERSPPPTLLPPFSQIPHMPSHFKELLHFTPFVTQPSSSPAATVEFGVSQSFENVLLLAEKALHAAVQNETCYYLEHLEYVCSNNLTARFCAEVTRITGDAARDLQVCK